MKNPPVDILSSMEWFKAFLRTHPIPESQVIDQGFVLLRRCAKELALDYTLVSVFDGNIWMEKEDGEEEHRVVMDLLKINTLPRETLMNISGVYFDQDGKLWKDKPLQSILPLNNPEQYVDFLEGKDYNHWLEQAEMLAWQSKWEKARLQHTIDTTHLTSHSILRL